MEHGKKFYTNLEGFTLKELHEVTTELMSRKDVSDDAVVVLGVDEKDVTHPAQTVFMMSTINVKESTTEELLKEANEPIKKIGIWGE